MIVKNPVPETSTQILRRQHPAWKRALDIVGVVVVTPLLAPLLISIAIYIRLVSPGPILFVQSRVGYGGTPFQIFKFRTMHVPEKSRDETHREYVAGLAREEGPSKKPEYRNELIPGGNLLRKLSIDEFPQLLNVARGSMSLVGPRPDVLQLEDYESQQLQRFEVLPGMTGLWQVSGKNRLSFERMIELDLRYIETRSIGADLRILFKTVYVLLFDRNE